jgi:hypothetical protein
MKSIDRNIEKVCASAAGSMGLAALFGACGSACGIFVAPLAGLMTSAGLGALSSFLPRFQIPLFALAFALGTYSLVVFIKRKSLRGALSCGAILVAGSAIIGWQLISSQKSRKIDSITAALAALDPKTRAVFQKGVYELWPQLGRAPSILELQAHLGYPSADPVLHAFADLQKMGFRTVFYPGTTEIKWFWPFSSLDHGIDVTLDGGKAVHARCAIDALGMSAMFGRSARVSIRTPLDQKIIELEVNNARVTRSDPNLVVSTGDSCDEMLFFSSKDEFNRYVRAGKKNLRLLTLQTALDHGVESFGRILKL